MFETYTPIVLLTTIILLLLLSVTLKLHSTQVDYSTAFYQAPTQNDVFIAITKGYQHLNKMRFPTSIK